MGDDARDDGQNRFDELGGVLLPRPLDFQGPDIDPYLPWVREVDVATMMAELSHEIEAGAAKEPLPSLGASSNAEEQHLEKEFFDIKGIFVYFCKVCVVSYFDGSVISWVGFKKELEGYGTGDHGQVVTAMNTKVRDVVDAL